VLTDDLAALSFECDHSGKTASRSRARHASKASGNSAMLFRIAVRSVSLCPLRVFSNQVGQASWNPESRASKL